jgi:hypothetical protein
MAFLLSRRSVLRSLVAAGIAAATTRIAVVRPECSAWKLPGGGLARVLPPSRFPLSYEDVIRFQGDWAVQGHPNEVVNPKGIVYNPDLDRLIVSLSPYTYGSDQMVCALTSVARDGSRRDPYAAGYRMSRDVEPQLAIVPPAGPPVRAGFTPGDIYVGRGPGDLISRLSNSGKVLQDPFVDLGAEKRVAGVDSTGPWGGLAFDTEGDFGGALVVAEVNGKIYRVDARGVFQGVADLKQRLEGVAVAPPHFGPFAKHIVVGVEGAADNDPASGRIYAIGADGNVMLLADIGFAAESIQFVPRNGGAYYQTELRFDGQAENRILLAGASQFLSRRGRMIIVNEYWGEVWEVDWNGREYTQSLIGRPPRPWTTASMCDQSTEFEAGCFAEKPPTLPRWSDWVRIPGHAATDRAPAAAFDAAGVLHVLVKGTDDHRIYANSTETPLQDGPSPRMGWIGWRALPGGPRTDHALAMIHFGGHLFAFAVRPDGAVVQQRLTLPVTAGARVDEAWPEVPGGTRTDAAVSAASANGKLVVAAKGIVDGRVYVNEMTPRERWTGWRLVPGGARTDTAPATVGFQGELYVLIKELRSRRILATVRLRNGSWTEWAELPGEGVTDAPVAAVAAVARGASAVDEQLYVFATAAHGGGPYWNVASGTGTWSGWQPLPAGGPKDIALAGTVFEDRPSGPGLCLLGNGTNDRQISLRWT